MKNIIISAFILFAGFNVANAQTPAAKPVTKVHKTAVNKKDTTVKVPVKNENKMTKATAKKDDKMSKASSNTTGLKKNGTPDMRMKMNKNLKSTDTAGPVKKNGTPDMRYKVNKKK